MIYGWLRVWKYLGKLGVCKFWVFPFGIRFALGIKRDQRDSDIEFLTKIWVDSSNYWRKYCFTFPDLLIKVATVQMSDYEAFQILDLCHFFPRKVVKDKLRTKIRRSRIQGWWKTVWSKNSSSFGIRRKCIGFCRRDRNDKVCNQ